MPVIRISKAFMVLAMALFASLVTFNHVTDYGTNFVFVRHVLLMDATFPGNGAAHRAILAPWAHHVSYCMIILLELGTAALCLVGGTKLLLAYKAERLDFIAAKDLAVAGLTLGFLTRQVAYISIGGEWFGMGASAHWNGMYGAFRIAILQLGVLIYVTLSNDD
ncbi:DUF2165 family protein [Achromobacter xylosoxidans]|jgi:predicted small integral membrane protein